jgi:hypothetical protein
MSGATVFVALVAATFGGFIATAFYTDSVWWSLLGAGASQLAAASVIWRTNFGRWNPFS